MAQAVANGVLVTTNDTTCTVPEFPAGGAPMPTPSLKVQPKVTLKLLRWLRPQTEQPIAVAAKHAAGVQLIALRFVRTFTALRGQRWYASVRGTHTQPNVKRRLSGRITACARLVPANLSNLRRLRRQRFESFFHAD